MTHEEARKFVLDSFVTAFEAGNEKIIDQYFSENLKFRNYSVAKNYSLEEIKTSVLKVHEKYQDLKSEIKDVIVDDNSIAFRVEQRAFYVPDNAHVHMDVMNVYKLVDGKVKDWSLWFKQTSEAVAI